MREWLRQIIYRLRTDNTAPPQMAAAVFWGIFLGILPIYGVQTGVLWLTSRGLRLNFLTVFAVSNVQNPFTAPFLVAGGIALGEFLRFGKIQAPDLELAQGFWDDLSLIGGELGDTFFSCLLGDFVIGLVCGLAGAIAAYRYSLRRQRLRLASDDATA